MKFADLHLHTQFSDGTFTPEELAGRAQNCGLVCIALTDHDTVEGCARAAAACAVGAPPTPSAAAEAASPLPLALPPAAAAGSSLTPSRWPARRAIAASDRGSD